MVCQASTWSDTMLGTQRLAQAVPWNEFLLGCLLTERAWGCAGVGMAMWVLGAVLTGVSQNYGSLMFARIFMGAGAPKSPQACRAHFYDYLRAGLCVEGLHVTFSFHPCADGMCHSQARPL